MFSSKKLFIALGALMVASMVLAACAPAATAPPPETIVETVVVTEIVEGEPVEVVQVVTPTPEPEGPRTLVICQGQEPDTMYIYGTDMLATANIFHMLYEGVTDAGGAGGIDNNSFGYQPVIFDKLPSLADGDATLVSVTASEGDAVVDAAGGVVVLDPAADPPIMLIPAGGTDADAFEYTGGDVDLDQMTATFVYVDGVTWSDGTPVTASDSVYSFNLNADPDTPASKTTTDRTASYEALDDKTIVWTGLPGYKDSTYFINHWQPMPEHVWGQFTAAELLEAEESSLLPMGYGAYIMEEWVKGDSMTLTKNPNYFRADEGLPVFETVVVRMVGENSNANIAAILSGECDIVDQTSHLDDQSELLLELQASGQLNATFVTGTVWEHIDYGIQHVDYDDGWQAGDRPDFFSDVRTRHAFLMCMDRQSVVDTVMFGQSVVLDTYLPPQHPLFNADATHYDFDVEAGSALLEEAGWVDDDGDPVTPRVYQGDNPNIPAGTPLSVTYETTTATQRIQAMAVLQNSMAECGIEVELINSPASEWFADGPEGKLFGRRFDLGQFAWLTGVQPPCDLYITDETPGPVGDDTYISIMNGNEYPYAGWGAANDPGFSNDEYDAICLGAIQSLPGTPEYEDLHLQAQQIFSDELPVAPLYLRLKLAATRIDMCNFIMDPTANSEMWNVEEFDYGDCAE
jgi:peptide/nickel transport system substrate-binding protein